MEIDLSNCEKEPIHLVNKIQSHGSFVRLLNFDLSIIGVSDDLMINDEVPSFHDIFKASEVFRDWLRDPSTNGFFQKLPFLKDGSFSYFIKHMIRDEEIHLEFEEARDDVDPASGQFLIDKLIFSENRQELSQLLVDKIGTLIGYDRVMLYRFDEEYNGHVTHEFLDPDTPLPSYQNHRFPQSDIPAQARKMLLDKRTRYIQDVDADVNVLINLEQEGEPDLSYSEYRHASELHLEYLRNMNVRSTFTITLTYQGQLWGLIACHHPTLKPIHPSLRNDCQRIGEKASERLKYFVDQQKYVNIDSLSTFTDAIRHSKKLEEPLKLERVDWNRFTAFFKAQGYVHYQNGDVVSQSPSTISLPEILHRWVNIQSDKSIFHTNSLITYLEEDLLPDVAGAMVIPMTPFDRVLLVRSAYQEVIQWAGNPDKAVAGLDDKGRISPRKSFETWVGAHNTISDSWSYDLVETARILSGMDT